MGWNLVFDGITTLFTEPLLHGMARVSSDVSLRLFTGRYQCNPVVERFQTHLLAGKCSPRLLARQLDNSCYRLR